MIDAPFDGPHPEPDAPEDLEEALEGGTFESWNEQHLKALYNHLARLLRTAPNFYGRVISGMCHVILNPENEILDPTSSTVDLHPRFGQLDDRATQMESTLLWVLSQQGTSRAIDQTVRRVLRIEPDAPLTAEQIDRARRVPGVE